MTMSTADMRAAGAYLAARDSVRQALDPDGVLHRVGLWLIATADAWDGEAKEIGARPPSPVSLAEREVDVRAADA